MNDIYVGGLIGDKWRALGAERGPLGPPSTNDEESAPGRNGRKRPFWYGEIVWSPDQGPNMAVAGWKATSTSGNQYIVTATLDWGTTSPFNYDFLSCAGTGTAGTSASRISAAVPVTTGGSLLSDLVLAG
jgi:hypothetical protein